MSIGNAGLTDVAMASFKNKVWDMSPEEIVKIRNQFATSIKAIDNETRVESIPNVVGVTYFAEGSFPYNSTKIEPSTIGYTTTDATSMVVDVSWSFTESARTMGNLKIKGFTYTSVVNGDSIIQSVKFDAWAPSSKPFTNVVFTVTDTTTDTTTQKVFGTVSANDFEALFSKGINGDMNLTWTEMQAYADARSYMINMSKSLTDQMIDGGNVNDKLVGGAGNDTIDGGLGADTMTGGLGNDTYFIDNVGDKVIEAANKGDDTVHTTISLTKTVNNIESFIADEVNGGDNNINIFGNVLNNTLTGNSGNNILDGGKGADAMIGGAGNDTYKVDTAGDTVTEGLDAGTDTVIATVDYTLGDNVENLTLTTKAISGTGNILDNVIIGNAGKNILVGNAGNDTLNGGANADTMSGGAGDDTYYVDNKADVVTENSSEGTDTVISSIDYTLGSSLENLTLTGKAVKGTGNDSNNEMQGTKWQKLILDGGAGDDTLHASGFDDVLTGGAGADIFVIETAQGSMAKHSFDYKLVTGAASDTFVKNNTIITDFQVGVDKIEVGNFTFNLLSNRDDEGSTAYAEGELGYFAGQENGTWIIGNDVGGNYADVSIFLVGVAATDITAADFTGANFIV